MIPGIASSQVSAVGTNWITPFTTANYSTAPAAYLSTENRCCFFDSKSNVIRYQTTAGSLTDFNATTWTGGGALSSTNSKPTWGNGWVFFPNANATTGVIYYGYSTSVALATYTSIADPRAVVVHGSQFIAIGANAATSIGVVSGGTAILWNSVTNPGSGSFVGGASSGTRIVGIQSSSLIKYIDGAPSKTSTWSAASTTGLSGTYNDIEYANGYWVIVGSSGLLGYSTTGIGAWTTVNAGFGTSAILSICFYKGRWYAIGLNTTVNSFEIRRSNDANPGSNWSSVHLTGSPSLSYGIRSFQNLIILSQSSIRVAL